MVNIAEFDDSIKLIAQKHALKVSSNSGMWSYMDKFYLRGTIEHLQTTAQSE